MTQRFRRQPGRGIRPAQKQTDAFAEWLDRHHALLPPAADESEARQIRYILHMDLLGDHWDIEIRVINRPDAPPSTRGRQASLGDLTESNGQHRVLLHGIDREILDLLRLCNGPWSRRLILRGIPGAAALERMLASGRLFDDMTPLRRLVQGEPRRLSLVWQEHAASHGSEYRLETSIGPEPAEQLRLDPPWYYDDETGEIGRLLLPDGVSQAWLDRLGTAPPVAAPAVASVARLIRASHSPIPLPTPDEPRRLMGCTPTPAIAVFHDPMEPLWSTVQLHFLYDDIVVLDGGARAPAVYRGRCNGRPLVLQRAPAVEAAARERLLATGLVPDPETSGLYGPPETTHVHPVRRQVWYQWLSEHRQALIDSGWRCIEPGHPGPVFQSAGAVHTTVRETADDSFDLDFRIETASGSTSLVPLVASLLGACDPVDLPPVVRLELDGPGACLEVPAERLRPVLELLLELYEDGLLRGSARSDRRRGSIRISRLDAPRLEPLSSTPGLDLQGADTALQFAHRLRAGAVNPVAIEDTGFRATLRGYQLQGLGWLRFLSDQGLGGVLADEMGLGKTLQVLAYLCCEAAAGRLDQPALVVVPTSLIGNWQREAGRFAPDLRLLTLHGPDRHRHMADIGVHDVVLTSYPLLRRDSSRLRQQHFRVLVLDEAQTIKNPRSDTARLVRELQADRRYCLSGTPLENHLGEYWALFDIVLPGFLGNREQFQKNYQIPIEQGGDPAKLARLLRRTAPFLLRRTKAEVAPELPGKTTLVRTVALSGRQAELYEAIRLSMQERVRAAIAAHGIEASRITILDALLKLRQVCCDPRLLPVGPAPLSRVQSAKFEFLFDLLPRLLADGRRVLLFSQFTSMLDLIASELDRRKQSFLLLTGQTRDRGTVIDRFRNGESPLFLISLKAGGVGLNLVEADTVIHYDPWWNPAVENQATDRAHRIGQTQPVFVYKLITEGTVEETIVARQERKRALAEQVVDGGTGGDPLDLDEELIAALLAPRGSAGAGH